MSSSSADRKRKQSQTITDLFTAQQKPNSVSLALSPSSKRSRLSPPSSALPATSSPLPPEKMYSFPTNNKKAPLVDLTKEENGSPKNGVKKGLKPGLNANTGVKKLSVKNFRTQPKSDPKLYFNQIWEKLDKALDVVFGRQPITFSLEELYKGVENVCRQGHAKELCGKLERKCQVHISEGLKAPLVDRVGERKNVDVLRGVLGAWGVWKEEMRILHWVFYYMDRSYLLQRQESLHEMVVSLFRNIVFEDAHLRHRTIDGACDLVSIDRAGEDLDRQVFKDAIKMFHELQVYTVAFEPRMLELSQTFIMQWSEKAVVEKSLAEYVRSSRALMSSELKRVEFFGLDNTTRRDLLMLLEDHLVSRKETRLVNQDDLADLLEDNAKEDLEQLYSLLARRRLAERLRPAFEKWIEDTGTAIIFDEKEQDSMVVKLLVLKKQLDTIWKYSFHRNEALGHALREAFETFINKTKKSSGTWNTDNSKPGEMIAKYVDMLLRGGSKAIPAELSAIAKEKAADEEDNEELVFDEDTEVNNQLDQVLDLFRFVHGKAVFEAFYKKDLARRLLMGRSASADAERSMLARLKTECGAGFTANLEQMFKDIELAREEMSSYKMIQEERGDKASVDLSVNILSASAWPSYPDVPVIIPPQIKQAIDKFETHYKSKHSGRKLDWKHALAHCQVRAKFPRGNKELVVSSFQAIVLLLFNDLADGEKLDYNYLKEATGLPPRELDRTLQSLACAKIRPLTKHPKSRDISPTDVFTLNPAFSDPKYRIKINTVQLKETKEENKATHEQVQADRNYETQAAIVRILKARKKIGHQELIAETIRVTRSRGQLDVAGIKRNIERLIEKEFLEREEDGGYSYIA